MCFLHLLSCCKCYYTQWAIYDWDNAMKVMLKLSSSYATGVEDSLCRKWSHKLGVWPDQDLGDGCYMVSLVAPLRVTFTTPRHWHNMASFHLLDCKPKGTASAKEPETQSIPAHTKLSIFNQQSQTVYCPCGRAYCILETKCQPPGYYCWWRL